MKCNGKKIRFTNVNHNENERKYIESQWIEVTQLYGTAINYYTNLFTLTGQDFLYGEQPTAGFSQPPERIIKTWSEYNRAFGDCQKEILENRLIYGGYKV